LGLHFRSYCLNIQAVLQADPDIKLHQMEKNLAKRCLKSYVDQSIASIKNRDIFGTIESALKKGKGYFEQP